MSTLLNSKLQTDVVETTVARREPVVVYNAREENLLKKVETFQEIAMTPFTADWMLFMDDMNQEMFRKISL